MAIGKQVRLFLAEGTIGGLVTAEIMNWTGHVLRGRRDRIGDIRRRLEAQRTGVYLLLGDGVAYIGQSDNVATRLAQHDQRKDFWNEVVVITSKDANLTSAHVRYLEARLLRLAREIGRIQLENGNEPSGGADLPEADRSDMEYFLEQIRVLLPVLGYDFLRGRTAEASSSSLEAIDSPVFFLTLGGIDARAQLVDGEFTILQGSRLAGTMRDVRTQNDATRRQHEARSAARASLIDSGALVIDGEFAVATRDIPFSSPSAAGAIAIGRASINGRTEWKTATKLPYGVWEDSRSDTSNAE